MLKTDFSAGHLPPHLADLSLAITENAPLPMATVEGSTHILRYANGAFCRMMAQPLDALTGRRFGELFPDKDECATLIERVYLSGKPKSYTERDRTQPHPIFWSYTIWPMMENEGLVGVMIQVTETEKAHGEVTAMNEALMLNSIRQHELAEAADELNIQLRSEIEERIRVEIALRESEARFRALFNLAPMGVLVCGGNGLIQHYNHRAVEIWGREPECGSDCYSGMVKLFQPDGQEILEHQSPITEVLKTGISLRNLEIHIERPDGKRVPTLVSFAALKNAEDEVTGAIVSFIDISEQKAIAAIREELLVTERNARMLGEVGARQKDEFLATLSHELRTPLNAILLWAQILKKKVSPNLTDLEKGLLAIERSAQSQAELIEDLLDTSRIVSGQLRLDMKILDLAEVIDSAVATIRPAAEAKRIQFNIENAECIGQAYGDEARLRQVFVNLCSNAVKFTPLDGSVTIKAGCDEGFCCISVQDSGIGIDPEFLPVVFERFRQADGTTTRRQGGLGLGLSICKDLVELHGGKIEATSAGDGTGATFTVRLPVANPDDTQVTLDLQPAEEIIDFSTLTILVVDDDPVACELLQMLLEDKSAKVKIAYSADDGIATLKQFPVDVIISDIGMPQKDGYEFLKEVRASGGSSSDAHAIAVTAFAHAEDRARALEAGYNAHVPKPVNTATLFAAIQRR